MSNLEKNLIVLKNRFPHVWNELEQISQAEPNTEEIYFEPIEQDILWLRAVKQSVEDSECIFVYGFGQGLGISDLVESFTDRLLMIYEPNIHQFYNAACSYDLTALLSHPNFYHLAVGENQLNSLFYMASLHMHRELSFVALRYYLDSKMDVLLEVRDKFQKYNHTYESNQNTHEFFKKDWVRNSIYQMADMLQSPSIESLKNLYAGVTAIIVASGPSLKKDIEWIKRFKSHAFVIAAGSSIQALVKHGIKPHLAVTLDGGIINDKVFEDPKTLESPLPMPLLLIMGLLIEKQGQKIYAVISNDMMTQYYMGLNRNNIALAPTPTVVGTAIQAAVWMGAKRVVLMGQDLSFPGDEFYVEGVNHVEEAHNKRSVEHAEIEVLNVHGEMNKTNVSFMFMKDALEKLFSSLPAIEFINTTRNGASLEGTTWEPIEEAYKKVCSEIFVEELLTESILAYKANIDPGYIRFTKSQLQSTMDDFNKVEFEVKTLLKVLNPIREMSRTKPSKCQNTIIDIEERWAGIVNRDWFTHIYENVSPRELAAFDQKQPLIALEQNVIKKADLLYDILGTLLKDIKSKFDFLNEIFKEAISRIEDIELKEA